MSARAVRLAVAYAAGVIFGVGLVLSGMAMPAKVIGFLDVTGARGAWDPTLAFVMGGAVMVHMIGYRLVRRRARPLFDVAFHLPTRRDLDLRLIGGSAVFGAGWGLAGYCPGPALVGAASGATPALVFTVFMLVGVLMQRTLPSAPVV